MSKKEVIVSTSFGQAGANNMTKLLKNKFKCDIIQLPKYDSAKGMWVIKYVDSRLENS